MLPFYETVSWIWSFGNKNPWNSLGPHGLMKSGVICLRSQVSLLKPVRYPYSSFQRDSFLFVLFPFSICLPFGLLAWFFFFSERFSFRASSFYCTGMTSREGALTARKGCKPARSVPPGLRTYGARAAKALVRWCLQKYFVEQFFIIVFSTYLFFLTCLCLE